MIEHPFQVSTHGGLQLLRPGTSIIRCALDRRPKLLHGLARRYTCQVRVIACGDKCQSAKSMFQSQQAGHIIQI